MSSMTSAEIIGEIAAERVVERMLKGIAGVDILSPSLQDLSQMVYLALLEYDEEKIVGLWQRNEMQFFISRILENNYHSQNSRYHYCIRRFTESIDDYKGHDKIDDD